VGPIKSSNHLVERWNMTRESADRDRSVIFLIAVGMCSDFSNDPVSWGPDGCSHFNHGTIFPFGSIMSSLTEWLNEKKTRLNLCPQQGSVIRHGWLENLLEVLVGKHLWVGICSSPPCLSITLLVNYIIYHEFSAILDVLPPMLYSWNHMPPRRKFLARLLSDQTEQRLVLASNVWCLFGMLSYEVGV